ncbi:MAG: hypothetical protein RMY28_019085 [Nostoc sp. ChiSLP01]|nr:hypothetical protein [Nostoc sp. CmiSLP01]MDZ8287179.1 hypothetical protein [Nostoc sp. ChiSLP01]
MRISARRSLIFHTGDRTHSSTTAIALFLRFSAKRSLTLPQQPLAYNAIKKLAIAFGNVQSA